MCLHFRRKACIYLSRYVYACPSVYRHAYVARERESERGFGLSMFLRQGSAANLQEQGCHGPWCFVTRARPISVAVATMGSGTRCVLTAGSVRPDHASSLYPKAETTYPKP